MLASRPFAASLTAAMLLASAFALVVHTAAVARRMRERDSAIASALAGWTGVQIAPLADRALSRAPVTLWFARRRYRVRRVARLLVLAVAVPALRPRLLSAPLGWTVLAIGVLAVLSTAAHGDPTVTISSARQARIPARRPGGPDPYRR